MLPESDREIATMAFAKLTSVEFSLSAANRERFTTQFLNFKREMAGSTNKAAHPVASIESVSAIDMGY